MTTQNVLHIDTGSQVLSVAFNASGSMLAVGGLHPSVQLWSVPYGSLVRTVGRSIRRVEHVAFSPDGRLLATGNADRNDWTIQLLGVRVGHGLWRLEGHTSWVNSVAFSPDGRFLVSGSSDTTARLWDVQSRQVIWLLKVHAGSVNTAVFSPDGLLLATGSDDTTVRVWEIRGRRELWRIEDYPAEVRSITFSQDGRLLAVAGTHPSVQVWDVAEQQLVWTTGEHQGIVSCVAFSPDGRLLATAVGKDANHVRLWDVAHQRELGVLGGHTDEVQSVAFSPGGHLLASGSKDGSVRLWPIDLFDSDWDTMCMCWNETAERRAWRIDGCCEVCGEPLRKRDRLRGQVRCKQHREDDDDE